MKSICKFRFCMLFLAASAVFTLGAVVVHMRFILRSEKTTPIFRRLLFYGGVTCLRDDYFLAYSDDMCTLAMRPNSEYAFIPMEHGDSVGLGMFFTRGTCFERSRWKRRYVLTADRILATWGYDASGICGGVVLFYNGVQIGSGDFGLCVKNPLLDSLEKMATGVPWRIMAEMMQ